MQTITEKSLNQIAAESHPTPSVSSQILENFKGSKEYRHAFVEEKVRTQLAMQIAAIREQREMSRPEFAGEMGKAPSWVFRLEDPNQSPPTISTLLKVAEAFDVDLDIRFRPFSDLLRQIERMGPNDLEVPSFEEEIEQNAFEANALTQELIKAIARVLGREAGGEGLSRGKATGVDANQEVPDPAGAKGSGTSNFIKVPPSAVGLKDRDSERQKVS